MQLDDGVPQAAGQGGDDRLLPRAGCDHDLAGQQPALAGLDGKAALEPGEASYRAVQQDGQVEAVGVLHEVVGRLVLRRVGAGRGRERHAGQRVVLRSREEPQRVPSGAPGVADLGGGVDDEEPPAALLEVVRRGEAGLTGTDDDDVESLGGVCVLHGMSFGRAVHDWTGAGTLPTTAAWPRRWNRRD